MNASGNVHQNLTKAQTIGLVIALQLIVLLSAMDETIVAPAMPQLISDLNGLDRFCWVGTAYLLAAVGAMPIVGLLSDRYGRKALLLFSTGLFVCSSVLCGLAGSLSPFPGDGMSQLLMFRVLQGISGGGLEGLCLAVLNDVFGPVGGVKYMWLLSLSCAFAAIFGPTLGGIITSTLSWRWIFFINLPIGLICILVLGLSAPVNSKNAQENCSDIGGMLALVTSIVFLLLALNWIVSLGLLSIPVLASTLLAALSFVLFWWIESRSKNPAIPFSILSDSTVICCVGGQVLTGAYMLAATFFLPLLFTLRLHKTGIEAAGLFTPFMLSIVIGSILGGQFLSRVGLCRFIGLVGALLAAAGFLLLANIGGVSCSSLAVTAYAIMVGAGIGIRLPLHSLVVQIATPEDISGLVLSLMQAFRDIGGSIGLALASCAMFVVSAQHQTQLYSSLHSALHASNTLLNHEHVKTASSIAVAGCLNGNPDACTFVFCLCAGLALLSAVVDMFLPEDLLRASACKSLPSAQIAKVTGPHQILTPVQL